MPDEAHRSRTRQNPDVEKAIAAYRDKNPDFVRYIQSLPRERLENIAILRQIETEARKAAQVIAERENSLLKRPAPGDIPGLE